MAGASSTNGALSTAWSRLFQCPLPDPEQARRWRFLNAALLVLSVLATVAGLALLFFGARWIGEVGLVTAAIYVTLFVVNRRGGVELAAVSFVALMLVAVVVASLDATRPVLFAVIVPLMIVIPVTVAGVVLSWRGVLVSLGSALGSMSWLYLAGIPQLESVRREHFDVVAGLTTLLAIVVLGVGAFTAISNRQLATEREKLRREREKSERLLLNVLPAPIAARLKEDQQPIAESFPAVTVLFADIVGFTELSSRFAPEEVVRWLNEIFSSFDRIGDELGLEKIKTIGDAYMAVAGLPRPRADHALVAAEMALRMREELTRHVAPTGEPVQMRIGIHSGHVVAGVIGTRKFIYDLWGDTVNTASRMESHGLPGMIQVTATTRELLGDAYSFGDRGVIHVKGKGPMPLYLLDGRRAHQRAHG